MDEVVFGIGSVTIDEARLQKISIEHEIQCLELELYEEVYKEDSDNGRIADIETDLEDLRVIRNELSRLFFMNN